MRRFKLATRLYGLLACFAAGLALVVAIALVSQARSLREERIAQLSAITQTAAGIVENNRALAAKGVISEDEAKARSRADIAAMRFGNGDYVYVQTEKGVTIAHPNAETIGKDRLHAADSNGFQYAADVIPRAIRDGWATVDFAYPRLNAKEPSPKIGFYRYDRSWGWMIASGVYTDDIATETWRKGLQFGAGVLILLTVLGGLAFTIVRSITEPLAQLRGAMRALSEGRLETQVEGADRRDEIGQMARAVLVFKDSAVERLRLAAETAQTRQMADADRTRTEAERSRQAEDQDFVVKAVASGLERLATRELTFRLNVPFPPAYEQLRTNFNSAIAQLQDTIRSVAGNAQMIRSGSTEITQATDDLSRRTEQQAASLEETAAALDEITATVRKTAEGANHARQVVAGAQETAEKSGAVVREAVAAMSEIETSSGQIGQIIGVIDEIAFQTNLLALNAGVEAARAGEAGKGFAVVAQEVRGLAQRSAEAAKEIKALISRSGGQVIAGVELVGEAGQALTQIATQVNEINTIVAEIAASAGEQAGALAEVNTAVNQMDQVTQQNAAMVEETTAASHALADEAERLAAEMERFQIGDAAHQVGTRRALPSSTARARWPALVRAVKGNAALKLEADRVA